MNLNGGQRVVVVIGWGLALATVAAAVSAELAPPLGDDAWFNYAPNEGVLYGHRPETSWAGAFIWFVAVLAWVAGSLVLLRSPRSSSPSSS